VYHVVITSYQLAVQDAFAFKRKRWYYLVLDEAQNIKNFQSQRWQTLISFNTQRRLLLSGTPLQNTLLELWSLLHFLMPYIFRSRKEFSYWFANPMTSMIEGTSDHNSDVIQRLHGILRPFILRRLKKDVETQMPGKFEHVLKCQLSRRQMYLYEEFMARSSTRKALKSGSGNFMTMMNVLMQLRKVCNHPDLFEPRSVITPFVLDAVPIEVPSSILLVPKGVMERASTTILLPLWCGSSGLPSIESALFHDQIESDELMLLREELPEPSQMEFEGLETTIDDDSALHDLLRRVREGRERNRRGNVRFLDKTNSMRCEVASFPYPLKLQHAVKVPGSFRDRTDLDTLNTPTDLLALRRTQQQCANDLDELVKKFVFCIPKAGVRESPSIVGRDSSAPHEALLSPVEEYLHPFRSVQARLSSFFPDKKLIQFDSGKLQMLAELLRELKRGGHKTLIFTQMSKMLDILEAFLNLNGHTYLRLDGSTGVERRQRLMDRFNSDPKVFCFILSTRSGGLGINLTGADTVVFYDTDWYDPRI
jgi:SNF2 family DNA or RNA helicase